jgi:hypothetical protein
MARGGSRGFFEASDDDVDASPPPGTEEFLPDAYSTIPEDPAAQERIIDAAELEYDARAEKILYGGFGTVAKPAEETLQAYQCALVQSPETVFSPKDCSAFDEIIVACGVGEQGDPLHPAFNSMHRSHVLYAPLRRNLAILRNYLLVHYPLLGSDAQANISRMRAMAQEIGRALTGGARLQQPKSWWQKIIRLLLGKPAAGPAEGRFLERANITDIGIAFMYSHLSAFMQQASANIAPGTQAPKDWKMLPLEETPFSKKNMDLYSRSARMGQIAEAFEIIAMQLRSVDDLQYRQKRESVQHGKDILENLRIIMSEAGTKKVDVEDPVVRQAKLMLTAASDYRDAYASLAQGGLGALGDSQLHEASESIDKLSYRVKLEEREMQREEAKPEAVKTSTQKINKTPKQHKSKEPVALMLQRIDTGINRIQEIKKERIAKTKLTGLEKGKDLSALRGVKDGMFNTMSEPKITQVSNAKFVDVAKTMNEVKPDQPEKIGGNNQLGTGKG